MNRLLYTLLSATLLLGMSGCDKPEVDDLNNQLISFDRQPSYETIALTTTRSVEQTSSSQEWATYSWNDKSITVRATANDTGKNRVADITITMSGNRTLTIHVVQNRYKVGDNFDEDGKQGVVFYAAGYHGKIISLDETEAAWSTENVVTGATDEDDGMANMKIIKQIPNWKNIYPAFAWCDAKNVDGITGWYLPAKNELITMSDNLNILNTALSTIDGTIDLYNILWSSTDINELCAWNVGMSYGYTANLSKHNNYYVRAVSAFTNN